MEHFPPHSILLSRPNFSPLSGFASTRKTEPPAIALETGESKYKWDWVGALLCVFPVASSHSFCNLGLSLFPRGSYWLQYLVPLTQESSTVLGVCVCVHKSVCGHGSWMFMCVCLMLWGVNNGLSIKVVSTGAAELSIN